MRNAPAHISAAPAARGVQRCVPFMFNLTPCDARFIGIAVSVLQSILHIPIDICSTRHGRGVSLLSREPRHVVCASTRLVLRSSFQSSKTSLSHDSHECVDPLQSR